MRDVITQTHMSLFAKSVLVVFSQKEIYRNMNSTLPKRCRVCGGPASGFNYDALTCESCKVFFCRHSAKIETLQCKHDGNCEITTTTSSRKMKCPKCRLMKCFAIGMKKRREDELIVSNVDTKGIDLMLKISILTKLSELDIKEMTDYILDQYQMNRNILEDTIPKKRSPVELNSYELDQIIEAQNALGIFRYESTASEIREATSPYELLQRPFVDNQLYVKKTINFCLHFGAFNSLASEEQMEVMKCFSHHLLTIWFAFQYRPEKGGVLMFVDETETKALFISDQSGASGHADVTIASLIKQFTLLLHYSLQNDVIIRDLVCALLLFKTHSSLANPENFKYSYYLYSLILQRYLQYKCRNRKTGTKAYQALMRVLSHMETHQENKKRLILGYGLDDLPSFVREFYE